MRRRYIVAILTAIGVVGYLAVDDKQSNTSETAIKAMELEPDYIISGLHAQHFNKEGQLDRQINAEHATHYPNNNNTRLIKPHIKLTSAPTKQWDLTAKQGDLISDQALNLQGDVLLEPIKQDGEQFSLSTQALNIDLNRQIADTDESVTIANQNTKLQAVGMKMDLDKQTVQFKSQVRGHHVTDQH